MLATIAASRTDDLLATGSSRAEALVGGYEVAFWVAAGLVVAALVVAVVVLKPAGSQEADEGQDGMTPEELSAEVGTTL